VRLPLLLLVASFAATTTLHAAPARAADDPDDTDDDAEVPRQLPRLIAGDARIPAKEKESDVLRFQIHGEYQLRVDRMQSFPLDVSESTLQQRPGATSDSLGQNTWATHWLRVTPRFQWTDKLEIVGQMDVVTGLLLGDTAHDTWADQTPRDHYDAFSNVQPRWLYLDWLTPVGLVRAGQMPNHWGMGIVANDGDHPSTFGDYRYGSIGDGLLFGTKPLGKDGPWTIAIGGQYVFKDPLVDLSRGDRAVQGVLATFVESGPNQIGVYGVIRHQTNDRTSDEPLFAYTDTIDVGVVDVAGHFATKVPGEDAYLFGAAEAAVILGSTNAVRTDAQALSGDKTTVRQWGGAAQVGVARIARGDDVWSDLVGQLEVGYASGDADPYDGTEKRFTFDPNHKVGLLLFDEVMRWQTARAATIAQDPLLANQNRPTPGVDLLPTNGGVSGAQYVYPTAIVRPRPWLDLKGGMVIAQATADVVDPYRLVLQGAYVNYLGRPAAAASHDLGVELDTGFEARIDAAEGVRFAIGAQGGVLFPGGALEDASGARMHAPWIAIGRGGVFF
jgi:hypothetical protein